MSARILIIEDNAANLELLRYLLAFNGYEVLLACDGLEGVATALQQRPDLILCDLQMPGLDGYQVLAQLREQVDAVILAVTAFSMPHDQENVMQAGFNGYFSKPIDPETFVSQIEQFLPPALRSTARPPPAGN
ncbi:MAG: response regulator [Paucibacter sp.]|nr:response regulator [Roseateles sp.]